jgi:hypothetical protein
MKLSTYLDQRRRRYLSLGLAAGLAERRAAHDAEAVESAGHPWEPEEPGLPARLEIIEFEDCAYARVAGESVRDVAKLIHIPAYWPEGEHRLPILRAMVSIYNQWGPRGTRRAELTRLVRFGAPLPATAAALVNDIRDLLEVP